MTDPTIYQESVKRAPTQRETLLKVLREAGSNGMLNIELVEICIGYRSRIAELYQMGYKIDVENVEKGAVIYTLRSEPEVPKTNIPTAISMITKAIEETYHGAITTDNLVALLAQMNLNVVRRQGSHKKS